MAEDAVGSELGIGHLADQLRLYPVRSAAGRARDIERRLVYLKRPHRVAEVVDHFRVEAGADLAGVAQLAAFPDAQVQRAESVALVALLPSNDDEFLPLDAFDLQPIASAITLVGRPGLLRDDALAAFLADRFEQLLALADDMVAIEDRLAGRLEQCREPFLALEVGEAGDVIALVDQQVEAVEGQVRFAALQGRLEQLEAGLALLVEGDRFAVDQAAGGELGRGADNSAELVAPVIAFAGPGGGGAA